MIYGDIKLLIQVIGNQLSEGWIKVIEVVECSSIYSIDLAAILFSNILYPERHIRIYINDMEEMPIKNREFIHKLSIPTFDWAIDPKGQIRQIHIPIENTHNFLETCTLAINSYFKMIGDNNLKKYCHIGKLVDALKIKCYTNNTDNYMELIKQICYILGITNISIKKYRDFRKDIANKYFESFIASICSEIKNMPDGIYKFHKGGTIETQIGQEYCTIQRVRCFDGKVDFIDNNDCILSIKELKRDRTYFKGPLETYLLAEEGALLHLPWYGEASYAYKSTENAKGIEYISPITVSSSRRVAKSFDGEGKRLKPTGYSLLEYQHENVLKILQRIYPEKELVEYNDLQDWLYMINNYPVCSQKAAKSQNHSGEFVRFHFISEYKNMIAGLGIEKLRKLCYLNLGINSVYLVCGIRIVREYFQENSPYYLKKEHLLKFMRMEKYDSRVIFNLCNNLFDDLISFIEYFYQNKKEYLERIEEKYSNLALQLSTGSDNSNIVKILSKLEQIFVKLIGYYYEIALFLSCVLLKANIFTSFLVLGCDYKECVKKILEQRENKILFFSPEYFRK